MQPWIIADNATMARSPRRAETPPAFAFVRDPMIAHVVVFASAIRVESTRRVAPPTVEVDTCSLGSGGEFFVPLDIVVGCIDARIPCAVEANCEGKMPLWRPKALETGDDG